MRLAATQIIKMNCLEEDNFKIGFHLSPSMDRLHLHVISNDLISARLKNDRHWNNYTTELFLKYQGRNIRLLIVIILLYKILTFVLLLDAYKKIKIHGSVRKPSIKFIEKLLSTPLKCHKCSYMPSDGLLDLKKHIICHDETTYRD